MKEKHGHALLAQSPVPCACGAVSFRDHSTVIAKTPPLRVCTRKLVRSSAIGGALIALPSVANARRERAVLARQKVHVTLVVAHDDEAAERERAAHAAAAQLVLLPDARAARFVERDDGVLVVGDVEISCVQRQPRHARQLRAPRASCRSAHRNTRPGPETRPRTPAGRRPRAGPSRPPRARARWRHAAIATTLSQRDVAVRSGERHEAPAREIRRTRRRVDDDADVSAHRQRDRGGPLVHPSALAVGGIEPVDPAVARSARRPRRLARSAARAPRRKAGFPQLLALPRRTPALRPWRAGEHHSAAVPTPPEMRWPASMRATAPPFVASKPVIWPAAPAAYTRLPASAGKNTFFSLDRRRPATRSLGVADGLIATSRPAVAPACRRTSRS